jgi:hypothetical protein
MGEVEKKNPIKAAHQTRGCMKLLGRGRVDLGSVVSPRGRGYPIRANGHCTGPDNYFTREPAVLGSRRTSLSLLYPSKTGALSGLALRTVIRRRQHWPPRLTE